MVCKFIWEKYRALGIVHKINGLFTNLALIISDQCAHTTKVEVFGDEANTTFKDTREFTSSIFAQLENTFRYLMLCNRTEARFKGLVRVEKQDNPKALREALLNALVHRDYSFSGSIIINVNDKQMEFNSIGGLPQGLSPDDIRAGISQPCNKNPVVMFHRLHLIESCGTGIRRIYKLYENCPVQPMIAATPNTFKIVLPNMNAVQEASTKQDAVLTPQMQKVLSFVSEHGQITDEETGALH